MHYLAISKALKEGIPVWMVLAVLLVGFVGTVLLINGVAWCLDRWRR